MLDFTVAIICNLGNILVLVQFIVLWPVFVGLFSLHGRRWLLSKRGGRCFTRRISAKDGLLTITTSSYDTVPLKKRHTLGLENTTVDLGNNS